MSRDVWHAVALSRQVGHRPRRVLLDGAPVVLFRSAEGLTALVDRCPHRLAELSKGRVRDGVIECPYHGWRFDAAGACVAIPGHRGALPRVRVARLAAIEREGAVFVSRGRPPGLPYVHSREGQPNVVQLVTSATRSRLVDVAENILDATHTHFTHRGLLRGLSAKRSLVRVEVTGGAGWVQASYAGEARQDGLVSKLLDGLRVRTVGRYRHPGIAELEYWGPRGLVLATTFHLRQSDSETVEGIGWLIGPRQGLVGHLKAAAFRPMFRIALEQDRRVLASAFANAALGGKAEPVIGPLDFLRRDIEAIAAGRMPEATATPRVHEIEL